MGTRNDSTVANRVTVVGQLLSRQGEYGVVTALSRQVGVARQTLYTWRERGRAALEQAFTPPAAAPLVEGAAARAILTLLIEGHAGERGIQRCLAEQGRAVSLGAISAVVAGAGRRALAVLAHPLVVGPRIVAFDEIYGNDRHGAYLSVVDAVTGVVWQTAGPVGVDTDSWTLLLWEAQARGLRWSVSIGDGGPALSQAARTVEPDGEHRRDVWHVLHTCGQVHGRLARWLTELEAKTSTVARQAARLAAGRPLRGGRSGTPPQADPVAHAAQLAHARAVVGGLEYLTSELRQLLEVVVLTPHGLLDAAARQAELDALLALLAELRDGAPAPQQAQLTQLHRQLMAALPALVSFAPPLDLVHQQWGPRLGPDGLTLLAWAWQRRAVLGPSTEHLLAGLPVDWRPIARVLLHTWDTTVRASSPVETWHSVLRPHLAVHRTLSSGLLALLAVAYNHRVAERGLHAGTSPLQRSGCSNASADWLTVLGYSPAQTAPSIAITHRSDQHQNAA
ncbi:MAG TPA: hypothetical protein VMV93_10745 [Chloroflexota bacterium]|nr:hypothetical protein [Chloroflexota bacterium]